MSVPSWAKVGAKVVLIDNSPGYLDGSSCKNPNRVFTISEIYVEPGRIGCRVSEWHYGLFEYTNLVRFRPAISEADDVALFHRIVRDVPASERLDELARLLGEPERIE